MIPMIVPMHAAIHWRSDMDRTTAELLFMAYNRLLRCDPAGDKDGTVAEAICQRLWDAGYKFDYIGSETILRSQGA
jgi:hypothetical protein